MSKILVLFYQTIIDNNDSNIICYYESLVKELINNSNEVMMLNVITCKDGNKLKSDRGTIIEQIKAFSSDLVIAFNNQVFEELFEITNCPIALFDADSTDYFAGYDFIKKYLDRYYMVTFYNGWNDNYDNLGFSKDKICSIHPATSVKNENIEKDKNISFIGSCFDVYYKEILNHLKDSGQSGIYLALKYFWNSHDYDYFKIAKTYFGDRKFSAAELHSLFDTRQIVLSSILDLGLKLYGVGWDRMAECNVPLYSAFDPTPKYTLSHNQNVYNSINKNKRS